MHFLADRKRLIFLFTLYLFFYFYTNLINPYLPINMIEVIFVLAITLISFFSLIYYQNKDIDYSKKLNVQSAVFIILLVLLVFNPIKFPKQYNVYLPSLVGLLILLTLFVIVLVISKQYQFNHNIAIIIFLPPILQNLILISSPNTLLFIKFPYITSIMTITLLIYYKIRGKL